jgi:hypothetical protein
MKIMDFLVTKLKPLDFKQDHLRGKPIGINLEYIQPITFKLYENIHISVSYINRKNGIINN